MKEYDEKNRGFLGKVGWWTGLSTVTVFTLSTVAILAIVKIKKMRA